MNEAALRYAEALLQCAPDESALCETAEALMNPPELRRALLSPAVRPREKHAVLDRLPFLSGRPALLRFYKLLCDRGRLCLLPEVVAAYHTLALGRRNAADCVMRCVHAPDERHREQIEQMLCKLHHKDAVHLKVRTDPALLGGFTLEIEGVTYDHSVRGQLDAMARHLQERRMI